LACGESVSSCSREQFVEAQLRCLRIGDDQPIKRRLAGQCLSTRHVGDDGKAAAALSGPGRIDDANNLDAPLAGARLGDITWPADTALVAILREGRVIVPDHDDALVAGDELLFVTSENVEDELGQLLSGGR